MRRVALALVVLGFVLFVLPVLSLAFDEGAVPAASDAPPLPAGVTVEAEEVMCGSAGCWRELTLSGLRDMSAEQLAARLGADGTGEVCRARSLVDRRVVCTWVVEGAGGAALHVGFDRSW